MRSKLRLAALLLCALAALTPGAAQSQPDLTLLRIGAVANDQATPLLYAIHAGLFKRAGLTIDLQRMNNGTAIAAAVAGGSLDVGKAATVAIITAYTKGIPFTIIAPTTLYRAEDPDVALVVPVNSPTRSAHDLLGKTLGVTSLVTIESLGTRAWLDANGGDSKSAKFIEIPASALLAALSDGRIDGAPIFEPNLEQALTSGKVRVLGHPYDAISKRFEDSAWFATRDWVAKQPQAAARFSAVMHDASLYVAAHEAETLPLIAEFAGLDPAQLAHMTRPFPAPYITQAELQPVIDVAAKYGVIAKPFPASEIISAAAARARR